MKLTMFKKRTKQNSLNLFSLVNQDFEKKLSNEELLTTIIEFSNYKLDKTMHEQYMKLLHELNKREFTKRSDQAQLYTLLLEKQDILFEVAKGVYENPNADLLLIINRAFNNINVYDAKQIIQQIVGDKENIFELTTINTTLDNHNFIYKL